jgi:hypothetical protein
MITKRYHLTRANLEETHFRISLSKKKHFRISLDYVKANLKDITSDE